MSIESFLEHYGVKGMKKPTPPSKLDRVYRVANGTATLKKNIADARAKTAKTIAKVQSDAIKVATAQAKALAEPPPVKVKAKVAKSAVDDKEVLTEGETVAEKLLTTCGTTKLADLA